MLNLVISFNKNNSLLWSAMVPGVSLSCFCKDVLLVCSPNPLGNELFSLMDTSLSLGLFSIYLNYGGRKDKNTKAKKSFFLPPKCWNSLSLSFPSAFLLITVNNGFWCCFYWLSIWGHKNVNVSLRNNTFGGLARLFLLFKIFLL